MRFLGVWAALLAFAIMIGGQGGASAAEARIQFPPANKVTANQKTLDEFSTFYEKIEDALEKEDIDRIMDFYAEDYFHQGITKKQLKFMWLEVFGDFKDLYSVHVFAKITVAGNDAILVCTGGLFGVPNAGGDYTTVDQWVTLPHWVTKVDGKWRIIGGATQKSPYKKGGKAETHPFF